MLTTLRSLSLALVFFILAPALANADVPCSQQYGFAQLRDLIGHDIVGECLENQRYAANGNSEQQTTGGLLVWRKADNVTAFTDGYYTWLNGPHGLQKRLNYQRFGWESEATPDPTPTPRPTVDPSRIDPNLADAFQRLRQFPYEEIDTLYDWFAVSGARARFGPLEGTSQFDSSSKLITINEKYRNESAEALAHTLIWPLAGLHANSARGGSSQSWDECIADRIAAHSAQAFWWFTAFGWSGKQNPTQLEQWANGNLASYLDKSLGEWVRKAYRESCAHYGEPPPLPIQTPVPYPLVDKYIKHAGDLVGAIYLAYLDSLGAYASDDTRDFSDFYGQYLGNPTFRRSVGNAVREHLQSVEYLGPNLTAVLRSERYSLDHRVQVMGNVEQAVIRATITSWLADILEESRRRDIELELWSIFKGQTVGWLNSNPIPNPWWQNED